MNQTKNTMLKYPIGIQSFDQIINGNYVYVDKTALIYLCGQDSINLFPCHGRQDLFLGTPPAFREKPVGFDVGALFLRTQFKDERLTGHDFQIHSLIIHRSSLILIPFCSRIKAVSTPIYPPSSSHWHWGRKGDEMQGKSG